MEVGALFLNSPFPSSDLPEPDLELLSNVSPFLGLLLFPHMILDHKSISLASSLSVFFLEIFLLVISFLLGSSISNSFTLVLLVFPHFYQFGIKQELGLEDRIQQWWS